MQELYSTLMLFGMFYWVIWLHISENRFSHKYESFYLYCILLLCICHYTLYQIEIWFYFYITPGLPMPTASWALFHMDTLFHSDVTQFCNVDSVLLKD